MSVFSRLDRLTSKAVDRVFAVRFEFHPMKATPNGRSQADPERESWIGKGALSENLVDVPIEAGKRDGAGNDFRTLARGYRSELSVDRTRYPTGDQAKQGDQIHLDDLRRFEVASTRRDGMSRVVFVLLNFKAD